VASEKPTWTVDELLEIHTVSRGIANLILSRLCRKGWLQRLKRGLYRVVPLGASSPNPVVEDAWPLAMDLFSPCFISGWSAAEHWDFTEQIFNSISVVTARPQRRSLQVYGGVKFRTRTLQAQRMFGSNKVWFGSRRVEIANPHRLVVDILDLPAFGGGGRHTLDVVRAYLRSQAADLSNLMEYAERYGSGTLFKRLGFIVERFGTPGDEWLDRCLGNTSSGLSKLDPAGPDKGKIVSKWNLRINIPLGES
ncbi:MAG: type IV toxin-antitoxin system AbiEi family antitoxin domain-containing protein, partial [Deltaproteobacteria bacterium]|nr:type IV toxin-antitoxin system AbiEi family antitoxin domain-containing protein [Deltaproteobacteria bacterium]